MIVTKYLLKCNRGNIEFLSTQTRSSFISENNITTYELSSFLDDVYEKTLYTPTEENKLYTINFAYAGNNISNKWLNSASDISSSTTPKICPAIMKLHSIVFANNTDGRYTDIELYNNNILVYKLEVRNKKTYQLKVAENIEFDLGDVLSCYTRNTSENKKPSNMIINCHFIIL